MPQNHKILLLADLVAKVKALKAQGKVVVQSHGVYDIIHPGVTAHLREAKEQGDVLIVTVIRDEDVRRGPGRPIFPDRQRAENAANMSVVDYVAVVPDTIPFESTGMIRPNIFAHGKAWSERPQGLNKNLYAREKQLFFKNVSRFETGEADLSTAQVLNACTRVYSPETQAYLKHFVGKHDFSEVHDTITGLSDLRVLVIGDAIIDEYCYCLPMGKSAKSAVIVHKHLGDERFAGGALALANHISSTCPKTVLATVLGASDSQQDFIRHNLRPSIRPKFFLRESAQTTVKKRYVLQSGLTNQKLFEVNLIDESDIPSRLEDSIISFLARKAESFDLVVVSDFGHGLMTRRVIKAVEKYARVLAVNTQANGANTGYNVITKYSRPDFVCLDEVEARLAAQDNSSPIEEVARGLMERLGAKSIVLTLGARGSLCLDQAGAFSYAPAFSSDVIDTVGAGDAYFAFAASCFSRGASPDIITFIGNIVGALAVKIVCNKRPVERFEIVDFARKLLH